MSCHPHWLQKPAQVLPHLVLYVPLKMARPKGGYFWVRWGTFRVTTETNSTCAHWPCCYGVIFLSQARMTNHSYRMLQGGELKGKEKVDRHRRFASWELNGHPCQSGCKQWKLLCLPKSNSCLQLCLAVCIGVSNADYIQKYKCWIFKILLFQSLMHATDFLIFYLNKNHDQVILLPSLSWK